MSSKPKYVWGWKDYARTRLVMSEVLDERTRQDARFGPIHDDKLHPADFTERVETQIFQAHDCSPIHPETVAEMDPKLRKKMRKYFINAAAVAVAAVEAIDRAASKASSSTQRRKRGTNA